MKHSRYVPTIIPLDELRRYAQNPTTSDADDLDLDETRTEAMRTATGILHDTVGRARLADEQRKYDRANEVVDLVDSIANARYTRDNAPKVAREREALALRQSLAHTGVFGRDGAVSADAVGQRIADAIAEVRDGRAQSFVDFDTRALQDNNTGGYGVNTFMGAPVSALAARSIMHQLPGIVHVTATTGDRVRFPRFNAVTVGGVAEAAALTAAATDMDAIDIVFQKFATYETVSTELEEDMSAPALTVLGDRMLKDLAARVDSGLIQGTGASDTVGIFSQSGVSTTSVAALPADFDKVDEAIYQLELNDGNPSAWIMHPRSWRILKQIKTGVTNDKTTLLADPQNEPRQLRGLPVFTTSSISILSGATSVGSTAAVVDPSQLVIVTRRPARLEVSRDVNFSTDMVAIRATTRIGLGVIDAAGGISLLTDIRAS